MYEKMGIRVLECWDFLILQGSRSGWASVLTGFLKKKEPISGNPPGVSDLHNVDIHAVSGLIPGHRLP